MAPAGLRHWTARAAAAMSNRRTVLLLSLASMTVDPVLVIACAICAGVALGLALTRSATAPATCGVAWEVPDSVIPAAVMSTPGASRDTSGPPWEKQAIRSGCGSASLHTNQSLGLGGFGGAAA